MNGSKIFGRGTKLASAFAATLLLLSSCSPTEQSQHAGSSASDPLPSWNDGAAKAAILEFVDDVTRKGGSNFVPIPERIAVFDNDGTLWVERPVYTQITFAFDRIKSLASHHPKWASQQPFRALLEGDMATVIASGEHGLIEIFMKSHAGMTTDQFEAIVEQWLASANHPRFGKPYTDMVYQPMIELFQYLRDHDFKTYIVSGGGVEFMRPFSEEVYGIPPEQVIGSSIKTTFEMRDGTPVLIRQPEVFFIDDKEGKAIAIQKFIGRRPIAAFGNSDADIQMIQWTKAGDGPRLGLFVHHTDDEREYAYDRESKIGRLDMALDQADSNDWIILDMKQDWNRVFTFE